MTRPVRCPAHHFYVAGCDDCRTYARTYGRLRSRLKAYGRLAPFVDAAPAVAHLKALRAVGVGWVEIGEWLGVTRNAARQYVNRKTLPAAKAAAILAIPIPLDPLELMPIDVRARDLPLVEGIRLLRAARWTDGEIGLHLGYSERHIVRLATTHGIPSGAGLGWNNSNGETKRGAA